MPHRRNSEGVDRNDHSMDHGGDVTADVLERADNVDDDQAAPVRSQRAGARRPIGAAALGEICKLLLALPRYRHMYLQDLDWLVLPPLAHDRFAVARIGLKDGAEQQLIGGVIWASVSAEVDQHIREQIRKSNFPIRLRPEDWTSGDITWLLDVLAPNRALATKILAEISRAGLGGARKINAHPIVQSLIDPDLLQKMGAKVAKATDLEPSDLRRSSFND